MVDDEGLYDAVADREGEHEEAREGDREVHEEVRVVNEDQRVD